MCEICSLEADDIDVTVGCAVWGYTLFRNGTRTDSSISSYILATAGSKVSGAGGSSVGDKVSNGSRTFEGKLTSRDPLGRI